MKKRVMLVMLALALVSGQGQAETTYYDFARNKAREVVGKIYNEIQPDLFEEFYTYSGGKKYGVDSRMRDGYIWFNTPERLVSCEQFVLFGENQIEQYRIPPVVVVAEYKLRLTKKKKEVRIKITHQSAPQEWWTTELPSCASVVYYKNYDNERVVYDATLPLP
ncbi:MAG: hypothetical protein M0P97_01255 [Candidatus Moranbacteria bacterium]|jgi:hypothetical protein|nr:hypothetical protein [Candidatus Moranbacteria bacterium]